MKRSLVCLGTILIVCSTLAGESLYEPFDYAIGSIKNNNGGIGFGGPWVATRNDPKVTSPGESWGSLPVSGNKATGNAWSGLTRPSGRRLLMPGS